MVLYLQPEIKKGIRNEINFQDFVLREQGQAEGWDCSIPPIPSMTLPRKSSEGGCSGRKRSVDRNYKGSGLSTGKLDKLGNVTGT